MKKIFAIVAATLFAANVNAGGIYHGFGQGNPDLHLDYSGNSSEIAAVQPGVGSNFDRYRGWADGNPDLFRDAQNSTVVSHSSPADVYRGFSDNPDL